MPFEHLFKYTILFFVINLNWGCEFNPIKTEEVITKHLEALGNIKPLESNSYSFRGMIRISSSKIPFEASQTNNEFYFFKQFKVLDGMDFSPPMYKKLNKSGAYFLIDETELGRGVDVTKLPNEAFLNWKTIKTTELSPLYYFKKMGCHIDVVELTEVDKKKVYKIAVKYNQHNVTVLYVDQKTFLIHQMEFNAYHPQLGLVSVTRTIEKYGEHNGFKYPSEWVDRRGNTQLNYKIDEVNFSKEIKTEIYRVDAASQIEQPISNVEIGKIIREYIDALEKQSPFEESNNKVKTGLFTHFENDKYRSIKSAKELARILSKDILDLSGDYHFGIDYNMELSNALNGDKSNAREDEVLLKEEKANHFFLRDFQHLNNHYFYFKIDQMPRIKHAKYLVDSLMQTASKTKGLVIDLRNNTGGASSFNRYLLSYFLPENTMLFERVLKDSSVKVYTQNTTYKLKELKTLPIYILVNENTISAGEQLAYTLQNHNRAKIIGKTTFGAAHGSIDIPLSHGLIGLVPIGYEKHLKTNKDWESTGVIPDIESNSNELDDLLILINHNITK